jgi:hypothetical protein
MNKIILQYQRITRTNLCVICGSKCNEFHGEILSVFKTNIIIINNIKPFLPMER